MFAQYRGSFFLNLAYIEVTTVFNLDNEKCRLLLL